MNRAIDNGILQVQEEHWEGLMVSVEPSLTSDIKKKKTAAEEENMTCNEATPIDVLNKNPPARTSAIMPSTQMLPDSTTTPFRGEPIDEFSSNGENGYYIANAIELAVPADAELGMEPLMHLADRARRTDVVEAMTFLEVSSESLSETDSSPLQEAACAERDETV